MKKKVEDQESDLEDLKGTSLSEVEQIGDLK